MLDNWQRIEKVVNWTGLSVNAFARSIGLKRAENLYQIKKGNHGISKELAELITAKYSTVNRSWLLTGAGEMFLDEEQSLPAKIPYYKVEVVRLLRSQEFFSPSGFISVPMFNGCEMAALTVDHAMEPDIPYGSVLMLRKVEPSRALPGHTFVVMSPAFSGVRVLRREPGSPSVRLVPRNRTEFDEVVIAADEIESLYEVKGYMLTK